MPARAPLDVDLEDKLLYGLTPMRLGYAVIALLAGFALWSSPWAPAAIRAVACSLVLGVGATLAWGRWQGRAVDGWLTDIAAFIPRTQRVIWNENWVVGLRWRSQPAKSTRAGTIAEERDDRELEAINHVIGLALPDAAVASS